MPKRKKPKPEEAAEKLEPPMTPMIDVIFQLLIFFMCATKFKTLEGKMLTHLPKDVGLLNTMVANPNMDEVRIQLEWDETAPLMKTRIFVKLTSTKYEHPDFDALSADMARMKNDLDSKGLEWPFIIDPQQKVPLQAVVSALDACRRAKIKDVRFAAKSAIDKGLEWERGPKENPLK